MQFEGAYGDDDRHFVGRFLSYLPWVAGTVRAWRGDGREEPVYDPTRYRQLAKALNRLIREYNRG